MNKELGANIRDTEGLSYWGPGAPCPTETGRQDYLR